VISVAARRAADTTALQGSILIARSAYLQTLGEEEIYLDMGSRTLVDGGTVGMVTGEVDPGKRERGMDLGIVI